MKRYDMDRDGLALEYQDGEWVKYEDAQAAIQEAVLKEREACAKLAEPLRVADTIRARSKS